MGPEARHSGRDLGPGRVSGGQLQRRNGRTERARRTRFLHQRQRAHHVHRDGGVDPGRHSIKFGGNFWPEYANAREGFQSSGAFTFSNLTTSQPNNSKYTSWGSSMASFLLGELSSASVSEPYARGERIRSYALFAQDEWRATQRLTLSYGLRWEGNGAPFEPNGAASGFSPTDRQSQGGRAARRAAVCRRRHRPVGIALALRRLVRRLRPAPRRGLPGNPQDRDPCVGRHLFCARFPVAPDRLRVHQQQQHQFSPPAMAQSTTGPPRATRRTSRVRRSSTRRSRTASRSVRFCPARRACRRS